jgi:hypothetical protein
MTRAAPATTGALRQPPPRAPRATAAKVTRVAPAACAGEHAGASQSVDEAPSRARRTSDFSADAGGPGIVSAPFN